MAYHITSPILDAQPINEVSDDQRHPLGTIVQAFDPDIGAGEFIYLKGVASTAAGSVVRYDNTYQTALATMSAPNPYPWAVAMAATGANKYGWYQIAGRATAAKAAASIAASSPVRASGGVLLVAASGGVAARGAITLSAAASGTTSVKVMLNRPHAY